MTSPPPDQPTCPECKQLTAGKCLRCQTTEPKPREFWTDGHIILSQKTAMIAPKKFKVIEREYADRLEAELAEARADHEKFCEEAQDKTDKDFAAVREYADRWRSLCEQLAGALRRVKAVRENVQSAIAEDALAAYNEAKGEK